MSKFWNVHAIERNMGHLGHLQARRSPPQFTRWTAFWCTLPPV
jgi:hypothetical protein